MARRGLGPRDREGNEPWARLQEHLQLRYDLGLRPARRWEHPDPSDPLSLPLLLRQASVLVDRDVRQVLRTLEPSLDPAAFDVLRRVRTRPSAGTDLAQFTRLSPPRMSEIVSRLVGLGLAERGDHLPDLRVRRVSATPRGARLVTAAERELTDLAHQWLDDFGLDEQDTLLRLVAVLAEGA